MATPRVPDRQTYGTAVGKVARAFGAPLMPWQQALADVAGEVVFDPDTGLPRMAHRVIVARVPRRAGKSTLTLATAIQRMLTGRGIRCGYTAQTRTDAAAVLRDEWKPSLEASPLAPLLSIRLSNGAERLSVPRVNGATRILAPNHNAGHGSPLDLVIADEAWSFTAEQGETFESGVRPAMIDRPRLRQLWVISAAGTFESTWLERFVGLLESGQAAGVDYSADPDLDDLEDPRVWARVHPAVGHRITLEDLTEERRTMPVNEFNRAFLGVTTSAIAGPDLIPADQWAAVRWLDPPEPAGAVSVAFDVDLDGSYAALAACYTAADGFTYADVVAADVGTAWLDARIRPLRSRWRMGAVAHDNAGPAVDTAYRLGRAGIALDPFDARGWAAACQGLLTEVKDGTVRVGSSAVLDVAVKAAARRPLGDGWAISRRGSGGPVSPLTALALAIAKHRRARTLRPAVEQA